MARLERVFVIEERAEVEAVVATLAYDDTAARAAVKARGYRWDGLRKEWRLPVGTPEQARAEALALRDLGLALHAGGGNQPLALAETAVRYALPLPFPVALWGHDDDPGLVMEGSSRVSYTITADGDWDGHLLRGQLRRLELGERGRRAHTREVENGVAVAASGAATEVDAEVSR